MRCAIYPMSRSTAAAVNSPASATVDGCIPSDVATRTPEEIDEERRLLYVAMIRAKDELDLVAPDFGRQNPLLTVQLSGCHSRDEGREGRELLLDEAPRDLVL